VLTDLKTQHFRVIPETIVLTIIITTYIIISFGTTKEKYSFLFSLNTFKSFFNKFLKIIIAKANNITYKTIVIIKLVLKDIFSVFIKN
jgi:hypothetical protein